jgi:hypothetical protein
MKKIKFGVDFGSEKSLKFWVGVLENMVQNFKKYCEKEVEKATSSIKMNE